MTQTSQTVGYVSMKAHLDAHLSLKTAANGRLLSSPAALSPPTLTWLLPGQADGAAQSLQARHHGIHPLRLVL